MAIADCGTRIQRARSPFRSTCRAITTWRRRAAHPLLSEGLSPPAQATPTCRVFRPFRSASARFPVRDGVTGACSRPRAASQPARCVKVLQPVERVEVSQPAVCVAAVSRTGCAAAVPPTAPVVVVGIEAPTVFGRRADALSASRDLAPSAARPGVQHAASRHAAAPATAVARYVPNFSSTERTASWTRELPTFFPYCAAPCPAD